MLDFISLWVIIVFYIGYKLAVKEAVAMVNMILKRLFINSGA